MNKQFRFGNSNANFINDLNLKHKIIDYLFNTIDLSKFRYNMLNNLQRLQFLKQNQHFLTPNYRGYNHLVIFLTVNKTKYCVAIDRKKMSYHKDQMDLKRLNVIQVQVNASKSIFRGSIFDCKLIRTKDNKYIMLIKDCFHLMGNSLLDMEMNHKITHLDSIISKQFDQKLLRNFKFKINKLYKYEELHNLIENIIPTCSIPSSGIVFYPKFSGITIVYLEKQVEKIGITSNENVKMESYHIIYNIDKFLKARTYSYEKESKTIKLWLKVTSIPDVYNLSKDKDGDKLGIACIPNLKISHMCKESLKTGSKKFKCVFYNKVKRWIPIEEC
jgi:hypothetical protein